MIPLRSLPMLVSSLGVVAFVGWVAAFNVRGESLFIDSAARPVAAAANAAAASSEPHRASAPIARS
jgi:hypothetical protein